MVYIFSGSLYIVVMEQRALISLFLLSQILEHYDKLEEAEALLRSYKDKNEDNPNAHKFLYSFAVRQEWQKPARIDLLKVSFGITCTCIISYYLSIKLQLPFNQKNRYPVITDYS